MLSRYLALVAGVAIVLTPFLPQTSAVAAPSDAVTLYLDQPFVQGSYASGAGTLTETFNTLNTGSCVGSTLSIGTVTGGCKVDASSAYGGASTIGSSPFVGGTGSRYATTDLNNGGPLVLTLSAPAKYFGFWWSAGAAANTVKLYSGSTLVATMTTQSMTDLIGPRTASGAWPGSGRVTALSGATYISDYYYGNPRYYPNTSPTVRQTALANDEQFFYIHMFASGSLTFDKIEFDSGGFEFDNVTVSSTAQTPLDRLVPVTALGSKIVAFFPNDGSGIMEPQVSSSAAALTSNTFQRTGYTFIGWNTSPEGTGTPYSQNEQFSFTSDLRLYAQWQVDSPAPIPTPSPVNPGGEASTRSLAETGAARSISVLGVAGGVILLGVLGLVPVRRRAS